MLFLIKFEQKYTLDEIVYMHSNTNTYFEKERKLRNSMIVAMLLYLILEVAIEITLWFSDSKFLGMFDLQDSS